MDILAVIFAYLKKFCLMMMSTDQNGLVVL